MPEKENASDEPEFRAPMRAAPDALLGMLQRGRGASYSRSLTDNTAADAVVDCVVHDPRWDHQVEERSWLYARLTTELGVDLSRFRAAYAEPADPYGDSDAWLATGVLSLLAHRGFAGAVTELRHYLRSGRDLDQALSAVVPFAHHPEAEGLLSEILEVADDAQLLSTLESQWRFNDLTASPWRAWRRASIRMERVIGAVERVRAEHSPPIPTRAARDATAREKIARAASEAHLATSLSVHDLTESEWEAFLLSVVPNLLGNPDVPRPVQVAARRFLDRCHTPAALSWARGNAALDGAPESTALSLFANLAEPSDGPALFDLLTASIAGGNEYIYEQCNLVEAVGRVGELRSISTVAEIFDATVYSYMRTKCAHTLSLLDPDFANGRGIECLDDCEAGTRAIGIAHANLARPDVRDRIEQTAIDPTEDTDNRRAAVQRSGRR